jgi:hypothetical protein
MAKFKFTETASGLCLEGAGPERLASVLSELDELLGSLGVDLDTVLEPGISPEKVDAAMASVGLVPPEELVVWYGWHNGLRVNDQGKYLGEPPFVYQADVDWSVRKYRYRVRESVPMGLWAEGWFCMESDRGLAAFCSGNPEDLPLLRREASDTYDFVEESTAHQVVSLSTMVALWIQAIESGLIWPVIELGQLTWGSDGPGLVAMDAGRFFLF